MKKRNIIGIMFFLCMLFIPVKVSAQDTQVETYLDELDLHTLQESVDEMLPEDQIHIREMILQLCQGKLEVTPETFRNLAEHTLFLELKRQRTTIVQILLLAVLASVFSNFMSVFTGSKTQEISFYMVYLLLFVLLVGNFGELSESSEKTMKNILQFMKLLLPVYLLASSLAARQMTAVGFYEITLFVLVLVQWLIRYILMPGIKCFILTSMLNHVTKEAYLYRITELLQSALSWLMKSLLALVIGIQTIQRLLFPALDVMKNSIWIRAGSAIPAVGNTLSSVAQTLLGTAEILKNAIGAGGMVILIYLCIRPILRLSVCFLLYKAVSGVIVPVADRRLSDCVKDMADAISLLLMAVSITGVMFFLTLALVTSAGGGI